ncbi:MAG: LysR substrate-binding domain-containing protein [Chitinophagaceae bacterium]|nr:LysR substrate-binding domain-containing protein [Chitinophagaceae bacterium]
MNLQQLEYIVAIDTHRHFVKAAESCFVTQATLSMMVRKLEDELGAKIFDRSKQPVVPTDVGKSIIEQARVVLRETRRMEELVQAQKGMLSGHLRLGIIPTLAPYLLPIFLPAFAKSYPQVHLNVVELNTDTIIRQLEDQLLDAAILATPLRQPTLSETPMFYEQFVVFAAPGSSVMRKKYLLASDIDIHKLWLLEEGHCLRNQVLDLCELKRKESASFQLDYEAGSIETLKKLVRINEGITIIPELSLLDLSETEMDQIRFFKPPVPVREISMVTYRHFIKERLISAVVDTILKNLPANIQTKPDKKHMMLELS